MHQFIIMSDHCTPDFDFQESWISFDYEKCDNDEVIQIKACTMNSLCSITSAHLHCDCNKNNGGNASQFCDEIQQHFINDTIVLNSKLCPPGYYTNIRKFYIDFACDTTEHFSINVCTVNIRCFTDPKMYYCTCKSQYTPAIMQRSRTLPLCRDVNECLQDPCNPQEICTNTPGSYTCANKTCIDMNLFNTSQCSLIHWDKQTQLPWNSFHQYCSVINSLVTLVNEQCQNQNDKFIMQKVISTGSDLLNKDSLWDKLENEQRFYLASVFLQSVENAVIGATLSLPDQGRTNKSTKNIDVEIQNLQGTNTSAPEIIKLQAKGNFVDIDRSTITGNKASDITAVALIAYNSMDSILTGCAFNTGTSSGHLTSSHLVSNVVSAVITNRQSHGPRMMFNFTFRHTKVPIDGWDLHCAHWNYRTGESYWSTRGCSLQDSNGTHTHCQCNQISNLALLIAPFEWKSEPYALSIITYIGIPVSLVCLIVTIATLAFCDQHKSAIAITHMQLCVSLFLAELLFITGVNRTGQRVLCGVIAGFLHYLFLSAFVWMFLEGIQLYLMVRNIKKLRVPYSEKIGKYMYAFGYGIPAVIVAISAGVYPEGYGSPNNCWLRKQKRFNWSFLGPVCVIIGINTILFLITLWTLKKEISQRDIAVSKLQDTRMLAFKAIARVFILGCSWILGLFHFGEETIVMAYLFTIVNSFQGTFIFIILCLLNSKVKAQCKKWFSMMCKARKIISPKNIATITPHPN
ncbi:adhesion G protein-coupled receptor E3-like isoform X2 [Pristis pectinata]|nr:adhesion G protein-coupled receptor E3-like isoform X2 [Pristis pectinata]